MDSTAADDVTKPGNGTVTQSSAFRSNTHGVFYCPVQKDVATTSYRVSMQRLFSSERYDKKQLLCSAECKLYSRLDDIFFARNKIRAKIAEEEGHKSVLEDVEKFCAFESQVTNIALSEVAMNRPAEYNVIEADPVMEFHIHVSLTNGKGESLTLEIEIENDQVLKEGEKAKKCGFNERFVTSFKSMIMKLIKNFPA